MDVLLGFLVFICLLFLIASITCFFVQCVRKKSRKTPAMTLGASLILVLTFTFISVKFFPVDNTEIKEELSLDAGEKTRVTGESKTEKEMKDIEGKEIQKESNDNKQIDEKAKVSTSFDNNEKTKHWKRRRRQLLRPQIMMLLMKHLLWMK